jgi:GxxExxY protein
MLHEKIRGKIIGAAMAVLNDLKPGLDEKLYERALIIELRAQELQIDQQKRFSVAYRGEEIGYLVPDLIVEQVVVVDTKVVDDFSAAHVAQIIGYLAISKLQLGLLVNFKHQKLQWKRVIRERDSGILRSFA